MTRDNCVQFFLGSNTGAGFRSYFEQLLGSDSGYRLYILKGGPGTGKSSLMKKVGSALQARGDKITYVPCASDPSSLDAVLDIELKLAVVDGTAPHTLDPQCPGACEVILNAGDGWDADLLRKNRKEIADLSYAISLRHGRATSLITAADSLLMKNRQIAARYVNRAAIGEFVSDFYKDLEREGLGRETCRLLSAVSVGEIVFFRSTLDLLCRKLYAIRDAYGAAGHLLLDELRRAAVSLGVDTLICPCSVASQQKIDHLILPAFGTGFTTVNDFHNAGENAVELPEFMLPMPKSVDEQKMRAFIDSAKTLLEDAVREVAEAKRLHDELEAFYVRAMDFTVLDRLRDRILREAGAMGL